MEPDAFDEEAFFRAIERRDARGAAGGPVQAWSEAHLCEPLDADELARLLAIPITPDEVVEVAALVEWFTRRYPTARERFAYIRRARARRQRA